LIQLLGLSVWLPKQSAVYLIGVPIYTTVLMTMVWRAMARVQIFQVIPHNFEMLKDNHFGIFD